MCEIYFSAFIALHAYHILLFSRGCLFLQVAETTPFLGKYTVLCYVHLFTTKIFRWLHDEP